MLRKIVATILAISLAILPLGVFGAESSGASVTTTFLPRSTTATLLPNPDKGFVEWTGTDMVTSFDGAGGLNYQYSLGHRLGYCTIDLAAYRGTTIAANFLTTLQTNFGIVRSSGFKCVVLVAYDVYGGSNNDDTASNIAIHAAQLAPIFKANADVIVFAKAGFIGTYGEWWGSNHGNTCGYLSGATTCAAALVNKTAIRNSILSAYHPYTQVGFRYPDDIIQWFPTPVGANNSFNGSTQARVGMHGDCQLSGTTNGNDDSGTWLNYSSGVSATQQKIYMDQATGYTSYGGEISTSCASPRTDCASAIADYSRWHSAWLKESGGAPYTTQWASEGCLTQIENMTGYWLQLDSISHQGSVNRGDSITAKVKLRNLGWARFPTPRKLVVKACQVAAPNTCYTGTASTDLRKLPSQATSSMSVSAGITIPAGAISGAYQIRLSVPDIWPNTAAVRAFSVRFGNSDNGGQAWNDAEGYLVTGTQLTVN